MRIHCRLFGCEASDEGPFCGRCGAHIYDYDFLSTGALDPILGRWMRFRRWFWNTLLPPRCEVCNRVLPKKNWDIGRCDRPECIESWIPF
jgi:hypothetical protein